MMKRRAFLIGFGSLLAAPAVVSAGALMPVGNIDHLLYPVRGLVYYKFQTDELIVRIDRANFPLNMTPKGVHDILNGREINALFTKEQIASIVPRTNLPTQLYTNKLFSTQEWVYKGLLPKGSGL